MDGYNKILKIAFVEKVMSMRLLLSENEFVFIIISSYFMVYNINCDYFIHDLTSNSVNMSFVLSVGYKTRIFGFS